jgi:hypothetical protein
MEIDVNVVIREASHEILLAHWDFLRCRDQIFDDREVSNLRRADCGGGKAGRQRFHAVAQVVGAGLAVCGAVTFFQCRREDQSGRRIIREEILAAVGLAFTSLNDESGRIDFDRPCLAGIADEQFFLWLSSLR